MPYGSFSTRWSMGRRADSRKLRKQIARAAGQSGSTLAKWDSLGIPRKILVAGLPYASYIERYGRYFLWCDTREKYSKLLQELVDCLTADKGFVESPKVMFVDYLSLTTPYEADIDADYITMSSNYPRQRNHELLRSHQPRSYPPRVPT